MADKYHTTVLKKETVALLSVSSQGIYVDATLGGGGHFKELVKHGGFCIGIDRDSDSIKYVKHAFGNGRFHKRVHDELVWYESSFCALVHSNFSNIQQVVRSVGYDYVDGVLFDLGMSSFQLDTKERGFSYKDNTAPLDMRMDKRQKVTAQDVIHSYSKEKLYEIFSRFSEEQRAGAISNALVRARKVKKICTVGEIRTVLDRIIPKKQHNKTYARIFQGLRIEVNNEIQTIQNALKDTYDILKKKGRVAVISFHSLEDRVVKREFEAKKWNRITKKPMRPSAAEVRVNRRANSAKLRAAEKI